MTNEPTITVTTFALFALERCLRSQERLADQIDRETGHPYASFLIRDDVNTLRAFAESLRATTL